MRRLADAWEIFTDRVRWTYRGWTAEMFSWLLAARYAGLRFAYLAEVVTDPRANEPAWSRVDAHEGLEAACAVGADALPKAPSPSEGGALRGGDRTDVEPEWPWMLHFCEIYNLTYLPPAPAQDTESSKRRRNKKFELDKRAVKKVLKAQADSGDGPNVSSLLQCNAPLFVTPPREVFGLMPAELNAKSFRRSAWLLCTTLHAINAGLRHFRDLHCPGGGWQTPEAETLQASSHAVTVASAMGRLTS